MPFKSLDGFDGNANRYQNAADATQPTDLTTLQQVQALINARSPKDDVIVRTTTNINLASPGATLDGVTMSAGQRWLATGQTTGSQNGIYVWNGAAVAATRAPDADTIQKLSGAVVAVQRGTDGDKIFLGTNDDTDTLGTTTITFVQTGVGTSYLGGAGLVLSGSTFNVGAGTGIVVNADDVAIDTNVVTRKSSFNCAATTNPQTFTHNLGTLDVQVMVREVSTGRLLWANQTVVDANNVSCDFGGAPTAGQYRVVVQG